MQEYDGDLGHGVLSRRAVSIESWRVKKRTQFGDGGGLSMMHRGILKSCSFFFSLSDSTRFPHRSSNARACTMARKRRTKTHLSTFFSHFFKMFANIHVRKYMQSYLISCLEKGSVRRATHYSLLPLLSLFCFTFADYQGFNK